MIQIKVINLFVILIATLTSLSPFYIPYQLPNLTSSPILVKTSKMFRAMMSQQQQQQQQQMQGNPGPQLYQHSVASTLAQIGVDPGYYSDSECSSNSSDKVNEEGNVSPPQNKLSRIPEQQIQVFTGLK